MTVPSPCLGVCRLDASGRECLGCKRTLEEIAGWSRMTEPEKLKVLNALEQRRIKAPETKGEP